MRFFTLATILTFTPLISASVINLTDDNFEAETSGKIAFVKFFAPWCGHCKSMAPDWVKLADNMKHDTKIIIAEVDCTSDEAEGICEKNGVEGFPTLKYGDASYMEDYDGARSYDAMYEFASNGSLKVGCSPANTESCSADEKAKIDKLMAMSEDELEKIIDDIDSLLEEDEDAFEEQTDELEGTYSEFVAASDATKKAAKTAANYNLLKAVAAVQAQSGGDEL